MVHRQPLISSMHKLAPASLLCDLTTHIMTQYVLFAQRLQTYVSVATPKHSRAPAECDATTSPGGRRAVRGLSCAACVRPIPRTCVQQKHDTDALHRQVATCRQLVQKRFFF